MNWRSLGTYSLPIGQHTDDGDLFRFADASTTTSRSSVSTQLTSAADTTRRDGTIQIAPRRDAPLLKANRRFDKSAALSAASSAQNKPEALEALDIYISASSSKLTLSSYERLRHELIMHGTGSIHRCFL